MPASKKITLDGFEVRDNIVKKLSTSGSGYVPAPKSWVGKKVTLVLREPVDE
jgi:putative transposon-encoded protein